VHVLRTFTRDLNGWLGRLQTSAPQASETIGQLIPALSHTFREAELSYMVWRSERVQTVLQHGMLLVFFFPSVPEDSNLGPTL
jgi:hypothetical protein